MQILLATVFSSTSYKLNSGVSKHNAQETEAAFACTMPKIGLLSSQLSYFHYSVFKTREKEK